MNATVEIDSTKWKLAIGDFVTKLGYSLSLAVRENVRLLLEQAVNFTPPHSKPNTYMAKRGKRLGHKVVGLRAVERDILKTMRPLRGEDFQNKELARIIDNRDASRYEKFVRFLPSTSPLKNTRVVGFSPSEHSSKRNGRGSVRRDYKQVVLGDEQSDQLEDYIVKVQKRVGWAKAGWCAAWKFLGGEPPAYVNRHTYTAGSYIDNLNNKTSPTITLVNRTKWGVREGARIIRDAVKVREHQMVGRIRYGLRQIAKNAGFQSQ